MDIIERIGQVLGGALEAVCWAIIALSLFGFWIGTPA